MGQNCVTSFMYAPLEAALKIYNFLTTEFSKQKKMKYFLFTGCVKIFFETPELVLLGLFAVVVHGRLLIWSAKQVSGYTWTPGG